MPLTTGTKLSVQGSLGQGEVFSFGFFVSQTGLDTQAKAQAAVNAFVSGMQSSLLTLVGYLSPQGSYQKVRAYSYLADNITKAAFVAEAAFTTSNVGSGTGVNPLQTCVVASERTTLVSRSGRGRMYIPFTGAALTNHELTAAQCTNVANAVKSMFAAAVTAYNAQGDTNAAVSIDSSVVGGSLPVNRVIVDSRTDVQRRRASRQNVLFTSSATIP